MTYADTQEAYMDALRMERSSCIGPDEQDKEDAMSAEEHHEYLCLILSKLIDSDLTADELADLASALGIKVKEFYDPQPLEVIEWHQKEAA